MGWQELIPGYGRVRVVRSWEAFAATPLDGDCNAVCLSRELDGDFAEVARLAGSGGGVQALPESLLSSTALSAGAQQAAEAMLSDLERLRELGQAPGIECVTGYPKDEDEIASTDVYSFHVDSATVPTETILCTYVGRPSEGLRLDEARRLVDVPETRERLFERFLGDAPGRDAGMNAERFEIYLRESHLDLHYVPLPEAQPFSFGTGHLWRLAVQYPGCPAPAFIHRAPSEGGESGARLLLIS